MWLIIRVAYILLAIAIVVGLYFGVEWVLTLLGVDVPAKILRVGFVIIGLLAFIWALTGRMDSLLRIPGPPA
jgi:hypothetical protein